MASLEAFGVIQPQEITGLAERITYYAIFILVLALISYLVAAAAQSTRDALLAEEERSRQLAETSLQFEQAAQTEAQLRQREERTGWQLREAVARYSDYLGRVAAGDYEAQLGSATELMDAEGEAAGPLEELLILDRRIENTVQALVESLTNSQVLQRRYVQESWAEFARTGFQRDFRYAQEHVQDPAQGEGAWLASMDAAVREEQVTVAEGEMALPITLRGEMLGAIGLRREGARGWSEAELALAETIGDQLAETMESLRLLDQTRRRAARDRLLGEVSARMRESLEMETLLRTAASEMRQALGLDDLVVRLIAPEGTRVGPGATGDPAQDLNGPQGEEGTDDANLD
jgi:GAF domain-containing protein